MPRGGHSRSGPRAKAAAERKERGARTRPHHAKVDRLGAAAADSSSTPKVSVPKPPPHLTEKQQEFWTYYAPLLAAERRITLKTRDVLARYCIAQAMVKRINEDLEALDALLVLDSVTLTEKVHPLVTTLRQFMQLSRQYDTDLLLNPAADVRAPVGAGEDDPRGKPVDPMAKFAKAMKLVKGGRGA
jgi:phage terminase small subunit